MSDSIRETVPKVLKTLWDLENEMRGAAQNICGAMKPGSTWLTRVAISMNC